MSVSESWNLSRRYGTTSLSKSHFSSWGTPGRAITTPRGVVDDEGGGSAVGVVDGKSAFGNVGLRSLLGVMMNPRLRKRCSMSSRRSGSRRSFRPVASAMVWPGGRPGSARGPAGDDDVRAFQRSVDDGLHAVGVVADDGLVVEVDADVGQASGHPHRVGVDDLAEAEARSRWKRSPRSAFVISSVRLVQGALPSSSPQVLPIGPRGRGVPYPALKSSKGFQTALMGEPSSSCPQIGLRSYMVLSTKSAS